MIWSAHFVFAPKLLMRFGGLFEAPVTALAEFFCFQGGWATAAGSFDWEDEVVGGFVVVGVVGVVVFAVVGLHECGRVVWDDYVCGGGGVDDGQVFRGLVDFVFDHGSVDVGVDGRGSRDNAEEQDARSEEYGKRLHLLCRTFKVL
jgi:hypothetical protein